MPATMLKNKVMYRQFIHNVAFPHKNCLLNHHFSPHLVHKYSEQSKCLRVIDNYPRRTPIPHIHSALNLEPIHEFIYRLTDKFFHNCSTHPNSLVRQVENNTLPDLHKQYRKYIHKQTKHPLL